MSRTIVITAPRRSIGELAATQLAGRPGIQVRVLTSSEGEQDELASRGVEVLAGDLADAAFVAQATRDADSLFWLTPMGRLESDDPGLWHRRLAEVARQAIERNRIPSVVHLSCLGAGEQATGRALKAVSLAENILDASDAAVTHLRAAWLMENYGCQLDAICQTRSVYLPIEGSRRVPMVSGDDVARVAVARLLGEPCSRILALRGPDAHTFDEAAGALGRGLGREVVHVEVPSAQVKQALVAAGACRWGAELLGEMAASPAARLDETATAPSKGMSEVAPRTGLESFARETLAPMVASCGTCP